MKMTRTKWVMNIFRVARQWITNIYCRLLAPSMIHPLEETNNATSNVTETKWSNFTSSFNLCRNYGNCEIIICDHFDLHTLHSSHVSQHDSSCLCRFRCCCRRHQATLKRSLAHFIHSLKLVWHERWAHPWQILHHSRSATVETN